MMLKNNQLNAAATFASLPPEYPMDLLDKIRRESEDRNQTIVVLDDDPTGTQTVYGISVLTEWNVSAIQREFEECSPIFYILTNSRSLPASEANELAIKIGTNIKEASLAAERDFFIISRSDSTLRGHYPNEVEALQEVLGHKDAVTVLIPAFFEGGRYTINDIHYVKEGDDLVPVSETPFAQDKAFGFVSADLKQYVAEKTKGSVNADQVLSISIDELRHTNPEFIASKLKSCPDGSTCIVNAASYRDLQVFALGLLLSGKKVILRTAASIVPVLAGLKNKPLLTSSDFEVEKAGGVFMVVGSYVPKTTAQLQELLKEKNLRQFEVSVHQVLDEGEEMLNEFLAEINELIAKGKDVVVFTSRELVTDNDSIKSLEIGNKVSEFMTALVKGLTTKPKCVLAKGGITSSDTASKGLNVKRAMVMGQVASGVPVWKLGDESKFPGSNYIVFPGNVGDDDTLRKVYQTVRA